MSDDVLISVVDLETTGLEPTDKVIEAAAVDLVVRPDNTAMIFDIRAGLFNPGRPIPAESMAVHHIRDCMVWNCPPFACAWQSVLAQPPGDRPPVIAFAAHNAEHERKFIPEAMTGLPWLCTFKTALRVYPDAPSHKNQVLRYHLGLIFDEAIAPFPHRATHDAIVSALLLKDMLAAGIDLSTLLEWSHDFARYPRIPFGKHHGEPWSGPDDGYLEWMLRSDMEPDLKMNATIELQRRRRAAYVDMACRSAAAARSTEDLRRWWADSVDHREEHGIQPGHEDYQRIVTACATRRDHLADMENSAKTAA